MRIDIWGTRPSRNKRPWTQHETGLLAELCLKTYPKDEAKTLAKKTKKNNLLDRSLASLETRISLIRRAANGEAGLSEIPHQVKEVVREMRGQGDGFTELDADAVDGQARVNRIAEGLRALEQHLDAFGKAMATSHILLQQIIHDIEENN